MAKRITPPPSETYIRHLATSLQTEFRAQDEMVETLRSVRLLENEVRMHPDLVDDVFVEVRDPTVADEVTRVVATLTLNPPSCEVTPASHSDAAEANATEREHWHMEVLRQAGRADYGVDTQRAAMDASVGDGGAWTKLLYSRDTWEDRYRLRIKDFHDPAIENDDERELAAVRNFDLAIEDAKKMAGVPFVYRAVDVTTVYPVWDGPKLAEMVEISHRRLIDVMRTYGVGVDGEGRLFSGMGPPLSETEANKIGTSVKFIEHWTPEWVTYVIEGPALRDMDNSLTLRQFRHGYGRVPYFFAPGLMPNHWRGRKVGWGVSSSKVKLVEYRCFLLSLLAMAATKDVATPIVRSHDPLSAGFQGEDNRPAGDEHLPLNSITDLPAGTKMEPLFNGQIAPSFQQTIAIINTMISQIDSPRVSTQIGGGVEGAGFAISQILTEAKTKHSPFMVNMERMLEEVSEFLEHLVRTKVKEKVWVETSYDRDGKATKRGWLGLGPTELAPAARIHWHLNPEQPTAKLVEARYWVELIAAGLASIDQAIAALGYNPDEVRLLRDMEELRTEDWYKTYRRQLVTQEVGRGDLAQEALEVAKTGVLPGQGAPGMAGPGMMGGANGLVPDLGAASVAPGGAGAMPQMTGPMSGGAGPGLVVPQAGAQAAVQRIGP